MPFFTVKEYGCKRDGKDDNSYYCFSSCRIWRLQDVTQSQRKFFLSLPLLIFIRVAFVKVCVCTWSEVLPCRTIIRVHNGRCNLYFQINPFSITFFFNLRTVAVIVFTLLLTEHRNFLIIVGISKEVTFLLNAAIVNYYGGLRQIGPMFPCIRHRRT